MSQILCYLTTALHVSVVAIAYLQEYKTTISIASGNHYTVLLSVAIVKELELVRVCCGWHHLQHTEISSTIAADNSTV
jgi:hypothetical protein